MRPDDLRLSTFSSRPGFIAALDQSGGSTPKALAAYGVPPSAYASDSEMFDLVHEMRSRIMTSPAFDAESILGAILFEDTVRRTVNGVPTVTYLWEQKQVLPFLKVDKGLEDANDGVRLMKEMPQLSARLATASAGGVFGTKMRSVALRANEAGVRALVAQQFDIGQQIAAAGLVPILEPEVDITCPEKDALERMLAEAMASELASRQLPGPIALKLSIPDHADRYAALAQHPSVLRIFALSGGYPREEAVARLARTPNMAASFSRALLEGLSAKQSADEFHAVLGQSVQAIYGASV